MTKKLHVISVWDYTDSGEHYGLFVGEMESAIDVRKLFKVLSNIGVDLTYTQAGVMKGRVHWVEYALINDKIADLDEETGKFFKDISDKISKCHGRRFSSVSEVQVYANLDEVFGR